MNESVEWYWLFRPRDFIKQLQNDMAEEKLWTLLGLPKYGTDAVSSSTAISHMNTASNAQKPICTRSLTILSER